MSRDNYCGANTCAGFHQTGPSLIGLKCSKKTLKKDSKMIYHYSITPSSKLLQQRSEGIHLLGGEVVGPVGTGVFCRKGNFHPSRRRLRRRIAFLTSLPPPQKRIRRIWDGRMFLGKTTHLQADAATVLVGLGGV